MTKRISRLVIEVAAEVHAELKDKYGLTDKELEKHKARIKASGYGFPIGLALLKLADIHIDYEVQRDVIVKHVLNIIRKFDPRIVGAASCVRLPKSKFPNRYYAYDGQHRTIAMAILGFTEIPACYVETEDERFASHAFEILNDSGIKKIGKPDLHRIRLNLHSKGSEDKANLEARKLQDQFDALKIDLQETAKRNNPNQCGPNKYWFSHFDYAYKGIKQDASGATLHEILDAIKTTWPNEEEIDQGVFIGLWQLNNWSKEMCIAQPAGWMKAVLKEVGKTFGNSHVVHEMAKAQWGHVVGNWSAPDGAAKFIREIYKLHGGKITLPFKGHEIGIADKSNICDAVKPAVKGL
jgi:hypothetical protein